MRISDWSSDVCSSDLFSVVDLKKRWTIEENWLASRCGWSPFTGMELTGKPIGTIIRGHRVMWDDHLASAAIGEAVRFESVQFGCRDGCLPPSRRRGEARAPTSRTGFPKIGGAAGRARVGKY